MQTIWFALLLLILLACGGQTRPVQAQETGPRPEHPRPDFRRAAWVNLNGPWAFEFDPEDVGEREEWFRPGQHDFSREIVVPYPWEAPRSGIGDTQYQGAAWYRRTFPVPDEWAGSRVVLKFGAVDWHAKVWVNGAFVGEHEGGYGPFEFDVTDHLGELRGTQGNLRGLRGGPEREGGRGEGKQATVVVRVFDNTSPEQPTGKQTGWYTRTSGIWQTVYLEARPATYIAQVHVTPSLAAGQAEFRVTVDAAGGAGLGPARPVREATLVIETDPEAADTATLPRTEQRLDLPAGRSEHTVTVRIPHPQPWTPETPNLYFVRLTLNPTPHSTIRTPQSDVVHTYFGLRDVGVGRFAGQEFQYITLNGRPIYLLGALDQAFHPEGIYTYPSDEIARQDLERAKEFGLNFLRIHIKVDDPRFLYWADRLGVLLMCDMPNFSHYTEAARARWEQTLRAAVARDFNHPSILAWCLFNETWGLGGGDYRRQADRHAWVKEMVELTKELDPTRLVEDNSACLYDHVVTDINSWHFYLNDYGAAREHIAHVVAQTYPGSPFNYADGWPQGDAPLINSEYGGISAGHGDQDISWCFKYLTNELRKHAQIGGYIYTELMDIEWEHNGFMNYDRTVKEFGYEEVSPGFGLRDLNALDFLVIDSPPCPVVAPGSEWTVRLAMSHFSGKDLQNPVLHWRLDGLDVNGRWRRGLREGQQAVTVAPWTVTPLPAVTLSLPEERLVGVWTGWIEDAAGNRVAANYVNLDIRDRPAPRRECPDAQTLRLRWQPGEVAGSSWPRLLLAGRGRPEKVWGHRAGFVEYRLRLPAGVDPAHLTEVELLFEGAAKAASEKVEWDRHKEIDYPQTDRTKWPSDVRITLNGQEVQTVTFPDDPADARGILSHAAQFHPGSYGYLTRLRVPADDALRQAIAQAGAFLLRLEVPADAAQVGGFALFGDGLGMYPVDPTLTLKFDAPPDVAQVLGDGSSVAEAPAQGLVTLPTGEREGQPWRYTTDAPPEDWTAPDFDDHPWTEGQAGFGREGTPNTIIRTPWHSSDLWMRRRFTLDQPAAAAVLRFYHDEDMEIYLNGHLIWERRGYITNYQEAELGPEALAHFIQGENVLAVHCHQTVGGQFVDVGLTMLVE